jgi:hypothetical protein
MRSRFDVNNHALATIQMWSLETLEAEARNPARQGCQLLVHTMVPSMESGFIFYYKTSLDSQQFFASIRAASETAIP